MNIKKIYEDLPPWAKGAIVVGALFGAYFVIKKISKKIEDVKETSEEKDSLKKIDNDIALLERLGVRKSFSSTQYQTWANQLKDAFDGCGTTTSTIYEIMCKLMNDLDVLYLIKVYGTRDYDGCNWEFDFGETKKALPSAIESELDRTEISKINNIFLRKGIKYRF